MPSDSSLDPHQRSLYLGRRWIAALLVACMMAALGIAGVATAASSVTSRSALQISVSGPATAPTPPASEPVALAPPATTSSLEFVINSVIGRALNVPGRF